MAGTCPHCGISISGQLRRCPQCDEYCLLTQDTCPECGEKLEPLPLTDSAEKEEAVIENTLPKESQKKKSHKSIGLAVFFVLILILCVCAGYYYYTTEQMKQKEQAAYERLAEMTDPKTFRQFLDDYPESQHFDEVNERMLALQAEAEEWQRLLQNVNRAELARFVQKYPTSLRKRACEDLLDSIDWQEAVAVGNEDAITDYNKSVEDLQKISYTDYLGIMMSSITTIINAITYVLMAFVAVSLIVSSIMIGVITLISVQERTKEIGVLRAMGASKKDVSRVFNAETVIVGFVSGIFGILITLVLIVIVNIVILALTGLVGLKASLGFWPAFILIVVSMMLTLIAGLIPSRVAAKKDPVIALRTE